MKQCREQLRVDAFRRKGFPFRQNRDRIMAVQTLLMAGNHAEIADTGVALQLLAE